MKETLNHIDIALNTYGSRDNPTLILIHGLLGNRTSLAPLAQQLSSRYFTVTYDCRGHGQSSKPQHYTLADHAADLAALIDRFGGQAHVFGYSMGSYIAAQAAINTPQKIRRLILAVTKPKDDGNGSSIARLLQAHGLTPKTATETQIQAVLQAALWSPHTSQARRDALNAEADRRGREARIPILTAAQRHAVNQALVGFDLSGKLPDIQAPTLVIAGKYDGINPPETVRTVADLIPRSRFELFEHSGHLIHREEPEKLLQTVETFLTES
ncbi:alpha/beta fold hydrolase [Neisseria weaveri]|uniref:BioH - biotin biosynthesis protein n=1 Tax=Neisseria weaveri TaxID=28091 RepID=A0A3S4ZKA8_9NEIS|nr:alpha/beta hydrolase [Neisseria weaveri]EGV36008.1 hypothetical protein l13_10320 [Neisseria weaveri ATCC 51223]EGV38823.1 hypothetical protein l11_02700 [Neisseria weaveri LMG 5135]VEJ50370.1 bioH - biotin biosynthesis protein [Neisseria weaveri]